MVRSLTGDDILLITNLIKENNKELMEHVSKEIRMVKTTVQDNHQIAIETRDQAIKTNGRVNKLDNEVYGEKDPNGNIIHGKEGILFNIDKNKSDITCKVNSYRKKFLYGTIAVSLFLMSLQIPVVSGIITKFLNLIGKIL